MWRYGPAPRFRSPATEEIERLDPTVTQLWDEALQCAIAIQRLARTRDELLPLLLSGRVRVSADSGHSPGKGSGSLSSSMS